MLPLPVLVAAAGELLESGTRDGLHFTSVRVLVDRVDRSKWVLFPVFLKEGARGCFVLQFLLCSLGASVFVLREIGIIDLHWWCFRSFLKVRWCVCASPEALGYPPSVSRFDLDRAAVV